MPSAKKTAAKKSAAKKSAAKKTVTKKTGAKKASPKKAAAGTKPPVHADGTLDLARISAKTFEAAVGSEVTALVGNTTVRLSLKECEAVPAFAAPGATRTPFTLLLVGLDPEKVLNGDGTYNLDVPGVGVLAGVLVTPIISPFPITPGQPPARVYQICFS
jgi:hypothetical protein